MPRTSQDSLGGRKDSRQPAGGDELLFDLLHTLGDTVCLSPSTYLSNYLFVQLVGNLRPDLAAGSTSFDALTAKPSLSCSLSADRQSSVTCEAAWHQFRVGAHSRSRSLRLATPLQYHCHLCLYQCHICSKSATWRSLTASACSRTTCFSLTDMPVGSPTSSRTSYFHHHSWSAASMAKKEKTEPFNGEEDNSLGRRLKPAP